DGVFTKTALRVLPRNAILTARRVVALETFCAAPAALSGRNHHRLSHGQVFDGRAPLCNFADDLAAADVGHRDLHGQPLPDPQVEMIHPAGADADEYVVGADVGDGEVHRL